MEGSRMCSVGCVVHVDVHGECVMLWWQLNLAATERGVVEDIGVGSAGCVVHVDVHMLWWQLLLRYDLSCM